MPPAALSYEELVRRNVVGMGRGVGVGLGMARRKAAAPRVLPQELFISTSQKFVQETELSQRIREWEGTVQPLLQEQVRRAGFCWGPGSRCLPQPRPGTSPLPLAGAACAL